MTSLVHEGLRHGLLHSLPQWLHREVLLQDRHSRPLLERHQVRFTTAERTPVLA